jgi:hypothetical protein
MQFSAVGVHKTEGTHAASTRDSGSNGLELSPRRSPSCFAFLLGKRPAARGPQLPVPVTVSAVENVINKEEEHEEEHVAADAGPSDDPTSSVGGGVALLPRHGAKMLWVGREKPTSDPPWTLAASAAHDAAAAEGNEDQRTSGGGDVGEDIDEDYGAADRVMSAAPFPAIRPLEPLTVGR